MGLTQASFASRFCEGILTGRSHGGLMDIERIMEKKSVPPESRAPCLHSRVSLASTGLFALWLLQSGCATSPKLPSESTAPPPGTAVVLMRLGVTVDGKPADPFSGRTKFIFTVANRDTEKGGKFFRPAPVQDENFRKEGWAY